jgi:hypothetical protein
MDVSAVDGYNIGLSLEPVGGTPVRPGTKYDDCAKITCALDIS